MSHYKLDPGGSRFEAQAFATGALSFLGHSPTFSVGTFQGDLVLEEGEFKAINLNVDAGSLRLEDRVKESDREEIERRMRDDVLETTAFPEIAFQANAIAVDEVAPGRYRLRIVGRMSLHGVTRPHRIEADLLMSEGFRLRGNTTLRMHDYGIKPVTALGGTIRLKDEVSLSFDFAGKKEEP
jgi:polyisoprenoid-binding protein YceI